MKKYDIWSEGYAATGESGGATYHGSIIANSFLEACDKKAKLDKEFARYYDRERLTYWGCFLFNNEKEARSSFG